MKKSTKRSRNNNFNSRKTGRHLKTAAVMLLGAGFLLSAAGCGSLFETDVVSETTENTEAATTTEAVEEAETTETEENVSTVNSGVCYIAETEKEKALALQEYIENALTELAETDTEDTEDVSGGVEVADASTESSGSSGNSSSSGSSSSSSSSSKSSSTSSGSSSSSSSSSSSKKSSSTSSGSSSSSSSSSSSKKSSSTSSGSSSGSTTEETTEHTHTWETYTYTEEIEYVNAVSVEVYYCGGCGKYYLSCTKCVECSKSHGISNWSNPSAVVWGTGYITYATYTGQKCSVCGETKDVTETKRWTEYPCPLYTNQCADYTG